VVASVLVPVLVVTTLWVALFNPPFQDPLPEPQPGVDSRITRVYTADGREIATFHAFETFIPVEPGDLPTVLKQAVIAIEDQRFYEHRGVDVRAILRALWADLNHGAYVQGASTITQQYVKQVYMPDAERNLKSKVREAVLAGRLERELSKDEILHRYLSTVYFGSGAYGVGAAADTYFRKPVGDLDASEAALLAGLIQAPTALDPRSNPTGADARRQAVLERMRDQGHITPEEFGAAVAQRVTLVAERGIPEGPATLVHPPRRDPGEYQYFVDYVRRYLVARYGETKTFQGGLRVETSLDPRLQQLAEAAVAASLEGTSAPLEMSMVAIEPQTGLVRALVGGRDFRRSQVNLALGNCDAVGGDPVEAGPGDTPLCISGGGTGRQPGSAFKVFTLAKALEAGISPSRVYRGPSSYTYPRCRGTGCTVHNAEGGGYGSLTLRAATAYSVNTVFAQLVQDVGVKETAELAHRVGLTTINPEGRLASGEPYGPSLTLGAAEVSPLDMAAGYAVFANRGLQVPASPVVRVTGPDGEVLEDNTRRRGKRVLAEPIADTVNDILQDTVRYGTGRAADLGLPGAVAGKTGTSEDYSDAWFVGYTRTLSAAVWMGYADSQRPLVNVKGNARVYGGTIPAQTWAAFMKPALEGTEVPPFPSPEAIVPVASERRGPAAGSQAPPSTIAPLPPAVEVAPPPSLPDRSAFPLPTLPPVPPATFLPPPTLPPYRPPSGYVTPTTRPPRPPLLPLPPPFNPPATTPSPGRR
jgi:penicillin-binding protein 1A